MPRLNCVVVFTASTNFVAVTDNDQYFVTVFDVKNQQFFPKFRGFEKVYDAENDDYDEHEIEDMAFTPDESMLVYTNMFTSEVVFADIKTGERKRHIEGKLTQYTVKPVLNGHSQKD